MEEIKKQDHYAKVFIGTTYSIEKPETIGGLKKWLEGIISDLPSDDNLEVAEVTLHKNKLDYILAEGIDQ